MKIKFIICAVIVLLLNDVNAASGGGELMIFPTRIVFDKNHRAAQIDLTNTGTVTTSYRITMQNKRMTEIGEFINVTSPLPGEFFADKIIQYSPRQVELAPGAGQVVRIILRKPANLLPGEYRTHLVFNKLPESKTQTIDRQNQTPSKDIGITLTALIGVSIPIIIENGETSATSMLTGLKIHPGKEGAPPILEMRLERTGNRSLYGDLKVKFISPRGEEQTIATARGLAVYTPNPSRLIKVVLRSTSHESLKKGKIVVFFNESLDAGGKLLTQNSLELQ